MGHNMNIVILILFLNQRRPQKHSVFFSQSQKFDLRLHLHAGIVGQMKIILLQKCQKWTTLNEHIKLNISN